MTLHIVNKSPYSSDCLDSCLRVILPGDALLLIEEAVYAIAAQPGVFAELDEAVSVYALLPDLQARGFNDTRSARIQAISDADFVALTVDHPKSLSWY